MKNITIVGGGLVGSLLAVFLAKRGHKAVGLDGEQASLAGLTQIFRELQRKRT